MDIRVTIEAVYVLGPLFLAYAVLVTVRARAGRFGWTGSHAALRLGTAVYGAAVVTLTLFPLNIIWGIYQNQMPWTNQLNFDVARIDPSAIPNIAMLVPLGFVLPLVSRRATSLARVTLMAALTSLTIETSQLFEYIIFNQGRLVDINDLLSNTLGGMIGYGVLRALLRQSSIRTFFEGVALPGAAVAPAALSGRTAAAPTYTNI
ncbi:VanZ family protein [Streptomyces sp. NPDC093109]|uniref:VanZ family protein n=1 Tax=Streptomyces sp. NPDC093109 TaxID=3154977 RepID=UPI00344EB831